ncbi:MAG: class I SAM-dependent methyltransferase [Bacteroidales bacterium]|nr:class I SAM-dependent methyltransferase [Bacteroidales bacterium]
MTRAFIDFVLAHQDDDTARLLLSAARYPDIDMPLAVQQIEGRRTAREKWPSLPACEEFRYPPRLNREQASSEATALHKARVAARLCDAATSVRVADLTGGMGIDTLSIAQHIASEGRPPAHVDYVERDASLCSLMEHNRQVLGLEGIDVHCADSMEWLASCSGAFDILYLDPARRGKGGRRVAAFEDCEPNLLRHMELLRSRCRWLMVKASPMIDIDLACRQLGDVAEVHVVSVKGECKEVLFVCGQHEGETAIHCALLGHRGVLRDCCFTRSEEVAAEAAYCSAVARYLYEPDAALMKAGPYNAICRWTGTEKLGRNTHLYTSDRLVADFCGRTLRVLSELKPNPKAVAEAIPGGRAHVLVRNYPAEAADLQRRLGLKEGGDLFVVAATVGQEKNLLLCCLPEQADHFLHEK